MITIAAAYRPAKVREFAFTSSKPGIATAYVLVDAYPISTAPSGRPFSKTGKRFCRGNDDGQEYEEEEDKD
jgi:hypothetical protein